MHLSWLGLGAFKVETKDVVVVTDPYSPQVASKPLRAKADIVTVSNPTSPLTNHLGGIQGTPFVITHPGEFEVKSVFIQGISSGGADAESGKGEPPATIFSMDVEGMRLVHVGGLKRMPPSTVLEKLDGVDVLFVPVGGGTALDAEGAAKLMSEIEPHLVVPMLFAQDGVKVAGKLAPVSVFLKEMGASSVAPVDRLLLKKRDLPTEETRIVVFQP